MVVRPTGCRTNIVSYNNSYSLLFYINKLPWHSVCFFTFLGYFFLVILDVFRVFSVCSQATGHTLWPRHLIGNMIFVTISRIIIEIYVSMQSACRISYTTMYKNIRFRLTRHLLTTSIWCGHWGCWYGPSDAYFLYYDFFFFLLIKHFWTKMTKNSIHLYTCLSLFFSFLYKPL